MTYPLKDWTHPGVWTNVFYVLGGIAMMVIGWGSPWFVAAGIGEVLLGVGSAWMHLQERPGPIVPMVHQVHLDRARAADHGGMALHFVLLATALWVESGLGGAVFALPVLATFALASWVQKGFAGTSYLLGASALTAFVAAVHVMGWVEGVGVLVPYAFAFMYQGGVGPFSRPLGTDEPVHGAWHALTGLASPLATFSFLTYLP